MEKASVEAGGIVYLWRLELVYQRTLNNIQAYWYQAPYKALYRHYLIV